MSQSRTSAKDAPFEALTAARDRFLMTGYEAILKGVFEHDRDVALIVGPRCDPFDRLFSHAELESTQRLLRQHASAVKPIGDAARAVSLADQRVRSGHNAIALVPNAMLHRAIPEITNVAGAELPSGTAMAILLEDDSLDGSSGGGPCPVQLAMSLDMPAIAPSSISALKDDVDYALRLSRSSMRPVALIVHRSLFQLGEMVEVRPNRAAPVAEALLARGQRKPRWSEVRDVTRMARRMELNQVRSQPNPGEVVPVGFITVGPTDRTVQFLLHVLRLVGRVPIFHLGMVHPVDDVALSRFLGRCEQVIVLEPRPGAPGAASQLVLRVAERMRYTGERCATVWGRHLPAAADATAETEADSRSEAIAHLKQSPGVCARDVLHPSLLIRRVLHLVHAIRPQLQISARLEADPPTLDGTLPPRGRNIGFTGAARHVRRILKDVDQWLRKQEQSDDSPAERRALAIDGVTPGGGFDRIIPVETWSHLSFITSGVQAVRQASREREPWIFIVTDFTSEDRFNLERFARGSVPDEMVDVTRIERVKIDESRALREKLQHAVSHDGLTILLVQDSSPPQFDPMVMERQLAEIDRTGVEPLLRIIRPTDEVCRFPLPQAEGEGEDDDADHAGGPPQHELKTEINVEHNPRQFGSRVRLSLRPMKEQIDIIRTRPPAWIWQRYAQGPLALPTPIHRHGREWRVHLAGVRGRSPGVAAELIADAGRAMGFDVAWAHETAPIGPGIRAWSQLLYTRAANMNRAPALSPYIPFGEADVLIGLDGFETLRAIDPALDLRVAAGDRTHTIVNSSALSHEPHHAADRVPQRMRSRLMDALRPVTRDEHRRIHDIASVCRQWFYTDRVTDIVMLGMAFQLGLVPATVEAVDIAISAAEARGLGRVREAFTFGRHLAVDDRMLQRSMSEPDDDLHRIIRRTIKSLRGRRLLSRTLADRFKRLVEQSITSMPGLSETAAGRRSLRDLVVGLYRCVEWGGIEYADQYATLVMNLYRRDHADTGRAMTRDAILPLAEAMLIRDPVYLASMATSLTERARFRRLHNIKAARGDEVERRYLTRIDLLGFGYRVRADLRSSDWPARLARAARYVVPTRWRGARLDRERRDYIISLIHRAMYHTDEQYDPWCNAMHRLHTQCRDDRLRDMAMAELRMLAEPGRRE